MIGLDSKQIREYKVYVAKLLVSLVPEKPPGKFSEALGEELNITKEQFGEEYDYAKKLNFSADLFIDRWDKAPSIPVFDHLTEAAESAWNLVTYYLEKKVAESKALELENSTKAETSYEDMLSDADEAFDFKDIEEAITNNGSDIIDIASLWSNCSNKEEFISHVSGMQNSNDVNVKKAYKMTLCCAAKESSLTASEIKIFKENKTGKLSDIVAQIPRQGLWSGMTRLMSHKQNIDNPKRCSTIMKFLSALKAKDYNVSRLDKQWIEVNKQAKLALSAARQINNTKNE